jgi:hypothetical protein
MVPQKSTRATQVSQPSTGTIPETTVLQSLVATNASISIRIQTNRRPTSVHQATIIRCGPRIRHLQLLRLRRPGRQLLFSISILIVRPLRYAVCSCEHELSMLIAVCSASTTTVYMKVPSSTSENAVTTPHLPNSRSDVATTRLSMCQVQICA